MASSSSSMSASPIVIDIGTSCSRIGRAGEAIPSFLHGREASGAAVWDSKVRDFEIFDKTLNQSKLFVGDQAHNVLVTESVSELDPFHFRAKTCEMLFEKQKNVQSVCFQYAPVLICFSNARQSGLVVDMSGGGCTATAVLDGWCSSDKDKVERSELGGEDLDGFLSKVENGPVLTKHAFNQLNNQRKRRESETFSLPDGTPIAKHVRNLLFDPAPLNDPASYMPLHDLVFTAAMKQSPSAEVRRSLMNNIVVSGGLSRTDGLVKELTEKLNELGKMQHPRIIACGPEQRHLTAWIGGSILGSLSIFNELGVSRAEYAESGPEILNRKFA